MEQDAAPPHNYLYDDLVRTPGFELYWKPWFNGDHKNWTKKTYNGLSFHLKMAFLCLVHCFFCCLGCGLSDGSQGYVWYEEGLTVTAVLTLLLKTVMAVENEPGSTSECWLTKTNPAAADQYLYVTTSIAQPGQKTKKSFRFKAIRLVCNIYNKPSLVNNEKKDQASHLCHPKHSNCVNPWHLVPETDKDNKSRQTCENGCAHYCPHTPTCIWTSQDGRSMVASQELQNSCIFKIRLQVCSILLHVILFLYKSFFTTLLHINV